MTKAQKALLITPKRKAKTRKAFQVISLNKLNRGLGCGFLLGTTLFAACTNTPESLIASAKIYEISGLEIGLSEAELRKHMGPPNEVETVFSGGDYAIFKYSGLQIDMQASGPNLDSPKVITGITSQSPGLCFNKSICPGDTLESVIVGLGETKLSSAEHVKSARLEYILPRLEVCWLWVGTKDQMTVSELGIACQP